jgi:hypothetical protein
VIGRPPIALGEGGREGGATTPEATGAGTGHSQFSSGVASGSTVGGWPPQWVVGHPPIYFNFFFF